VANRETNNVSVLLGNGDGTFQPAKTIETGGSGPSAVAIADFNGDNKPDVVVANGEANNVSVLLGKGDGTFEAARTIETGGSGPSAVAIADFNGDGRPDVVVANGETSNVSVLLGNGDGTFEEVKTNPAGVAPRAVAIADFNGDGKPDLVVADRETNEVSVLLNTSVGALATSPKALSFANQLFGTTSAAKTVTVTNSGSVDLAISSVTVSGNFTASGCGSAVLAIGASCTITVVFAPKGYGKLSGEATIETTVGTKKVTLSGTGLPPLPVVTTGSVDMTGSFVTFGGSVISQGKGTFYFQYGTTPDYGSVTSQASLKSEFSPQLLSASAALRSGVSYHFRLVASNLAGTTYGRDSVFTIPPGQPLLTVLKHGSLRSVLRHGLRVRVLDVADSTIEIKASLDAGSARSAHLARRKRGSHVARKVVIATTRIGVSRFVPKAVTLWFAPSIRKRLAALKQLGLTIEATAEGPFATESRPVEESLTLTR
jgi:hypothetical protein